MKLNLFLPVRTSMVIMVISAMLLSCVPTSSRQVKPVNSKNPYYQTNKYLKNLKQGDNAQRTKAARKLGEKNIKRTPDVVPALIDAIKDPYPKVRSNAAGALARIDEAARPAENALREALNDPYGPAVLNAARALGKLKIPDKELIPAVRKVLDDKKGTTRVDAIQLLLTMGIPKQEVISTLVSVLSDLEVQARMLPQELNLVNIFW